MEEILEVCTHPFYDVDDCPLLKTKKCTECQYVKNSGADQSYSEAPPNVEQVAGAVAGNDINTNLLRAIKNLDARDRLLIKLYYCENLGVKEINEILGWNLLDTKKLLQSIIEKLKLATASL